MPINLENNKEGYMGRFEEEKNEGNCLIILSSKNKLQSSSFSYYSLDANFGDNWITVY